MCTPNKNAYLGGIKRFPNSAGINLLQVNVDGIGKQFKRVHRHLLDYDIHVAVVSERKKSTYYKYERKDFDQLSGYTVYLESARAIFVRDDLKPYCKKLTLGVDKEAAESKRPEDFFHCCAMTFSDPKSHRKLLVVSCYRSPRSKSDNVTDVFETVAAIPGAYDHTIIAGDFNCHHQRLGSKETKTAGRKLLDFLEKSEYYLLTDGTPPPGRTLCWT